jgi:hypothetical protein
MPLMVSSLPQSGAPRSSRRAAKFQCRRIGHIEKVLKSEGFKLSEPQLKRLAGTKNPFNQEPTIANRVEKTLNLMRNNFNGMLKSKAFSWNSISISTT